MIDFSRKVSCPLPFIIVISNRQSANSLNRNLYIMLKFTERPKTPEKTSKKTLLSLKE